MNYQDCLSQLKLDRQIFATMERAELAASVPGCPKWDLADLLGHLGGIHRWATGCIKSNSMELQRPSHQAPAGQKRIEWLLEGLDALVETLAETSPEKPCPTWAGPSDAMWWARRQAHETSIHRWDAQAALGPTDAIPTATACDGIEEWLELFMPRSRSAQTEPEVTIHLHATDQSLPLDGGEWTIIVGDDLTWSRGHSKGDLAVRGVCSDLLLVLWNRIPLTVVETFGGNLHMERIRPT